MRNRLLVAVMAATLLLNPGRSYAQTAAQNVSPSDDAYLVVDRILMNRGRLALTDTQVSKLTALADRLRHDPGHLKVTGFDRVPGKWVPQVERVRPSVRDARRLAFHDLTPEQRRIAATILDRSERTDTAQR
jgi:hypothetical protein